METGIELAKVYDTLLCIPGMNDQVKLDLKISRKQVLFLSQIIERGLREELDKPTGLMNVAKEAGGELSEIVNDCLEKAGLTQLHGKLKSLAEK